MSKLIFKKFWNPEKSSRLSWWILTAALFFLLFFISSIGNLRVFLPYYSQITGFPFSNRTYLLVFQNNNELRPAGGKISSYFTLRFAGGLFPKLETAFENTEYPLSELPYPIEKSLPGRTSIVVDQNFNPDFPKTAEELIKMVKIARPEVEFDGVIAINYSFLEDLFNATGEVKINDQILTSGIIRKTIFNPFKLRKFSDTFAVNLKKKEIQIYFKNPTLRNLLKRQNWLSEWPQSLESDFLAVNEANFSGNEADKYIRRNVTYIFKIDKNNNLTGEVMIDVYNFSIRTNFRSFFRTFMPKGAKLIEVTENYKQDLLQEDNDLLHVFGNTVELKPGEQTQLKYKYRLPSDVIKDGNYSLFIPKQSGTGFDYYTLIFEAPSEYEIHTTIFKPDKNQAIYKGQLTSDLKINLNINEN